jgi:chaperonin GroES
MNLKVLGEQIIVIPETKTVTDSGIVIPEAAQELPTKGEIVAIGNKIPDFCDIKVGDKIIWKPYAGTPVVIDHRPYLIIRPLDIVGVVEEKLIETLN